MDTLDLGRMLSFQELEATSEMPAQVQEYAGIPLYLQGGVGDVIMDIRLADAIAQVAKVEIFSSHPEVFNFFKPVWLPNAKGPRPDSAWTLTINALARFQRTDACGSLSMDGEWFWASQRRQFKERPFLEVLTRKHPHYDTILCRYGRALGLDRRDMPFHSLGLSRPTRRPAKRRKDQLPLITLHDGVETVAAPQLRDRSTKQWNMAAWETVISALRARYPHHSFIQLGAKHAREIPGTHENMAGKTTLVEAFELLEESCLHIDGDSGLVHAATALGVPCVVLFGPTPDYFYGYPQNINLRAKTCAEACYWIQPDWVARCPIGHDGPKCMDDIPPADVIAAAAKLLGA